MKSFILNSDFIRIKDFYNFIRDNTGDNVPTPMFYFSPCFYNYAYGDYSSIYSTGQAQATSFFRDNAKNFARFRYCIQQIQVPGIQIKGPFSQGDNNSGGNGYTDLSNLFGGYTAMPNAFVHADARSLTMRTSKHTESNHRELHIQMDSCCSAN